MRKYDAIKSSVIFYNVIKAINLELASALPDGCANRSACLRIVYR